MRFSIKKANGFGWGLLLGVFFFVPVLLGPQIALPAPEDHTFKLLLTVPMYFLLVVYVYALLALLTVNYRLDEETLHVRWGFRHKKIPLNTITEVIDYQGNPNLGIMVGYSWPGHIIGYYNLIGFGMVDFFAADWKQGAVIIQSDNGCIALTPKDKNVFLNTVAAATDKTIQCISVDQAIIANVNLNDEDDDELIETVDRLDQDKGYKTLIKVNIALILALIAYLAIFYPGSDTISLILVFPGLAISIFVFMLGIASRLYQMMPTMAYAMFILPIMVSLVFIIISILIVNYY